MKDVKKGLQVLLDGLKAVTEQVDSLISRCGQVERLQVAEKQETKAKPKRLPKKSG